MATVPAPITWVTGQVVTAAQLNSNVRDAVNFILSPPIAVMRQTVAQSLTSATWSATLFDAEDIDRDNGHSTSSNTSRYTANTAGWYSAKSTVAIRSATVASVGISFAINGSSNRFAKQMSVTSSMTASTAADTFLNVGDYLEVFSYQSTGSAVNTGNDGTDGAPRFSIRWISS